MALRRALSVIQRLFAPFIPFTTESVWRWWQSGSVHRAGWPTVDELGESAQSGDVSLIDAVGEVLAQVRRAKTEAKVSQKNAVESAVVTAPSASLAAFEAARADLSEAGSVRAWTTIDATDGPITVTVTLAPPETPTSTAGA